MSRIKNMDRIKSSQLDTHCGIQGKTKQTKGDTYAVHAGITL